MAKIDEKEAFYLMTSYYNVIGTRDQVLSIFMDLLTPTVDAEKRLQKAKPSQDELASEVVYALLGTFEETWQNGGIGFKKAFTTRLRAGLRKFCTRKNMVDIGEVSITDTNPNPEEAYAMKEQIEFIKKYLNKHYDTETVDWFMRKYANGDSVMEIANDYGVTRQAVHKRIIPVLEHVKKYMEKINAN